MPHHHNQHQHNSNQYYSLHFEQSSALKKLADEIHELRLLPMPFGLLVHELIEVLDIERIVPGLTQASKLAEDFPFVDHHSTQKEQEKTFVDRH